MKFRIYLIILAESFLFASCIDQYPRKSIIPADFHKDVAISPFIFNGTVKLLNTSTIDADDVSELMVVQIDDILDSGEEFKHLSGKLITVQTNNVENYKEDPSRIFITDRWIFGESVAVINLADFNPTDRSTTRDDLIRAIGDIKEQQRMDSLKEQLNNAEFVFSGEVIGVEVLGNENEKESEHDPHWSTATIRIEEKLKGSMDDRAEISIIFPSSMDVMWFGAPKFQLKDKGVWILSQKGGDINLSADKNEEYVVYKANEYITDEKTISQIREILK